MTLSNVKLIADAHQEAHECNASLEVHNWIDWFAKKLSVNEDEVNKERVRRKHLKDKDFPTIQNANDSEPRILKTWLW